MSLYYEAAKFIADAQASQTRLLGSQIYGSDELKSKPAHIVALISEAGKWSPVISSVVEAAEILKLQHKLTPSLASLLVHDLLLAKKGVAAPKEHVLRLAVEKHKARLIAEFTKGRIRAGFPSIEVWRDSIDAAQNLVTDQQGLNKDSVYRHPRWIRVNALRTSLEEELATGVFQAWTTTATIADMASSPANPKTLAIDPHVPNLAAVPSGTNLTKHEAYKQGKIIFQDKASCFPAQLLNPKSEDGDIIDACAAPGNKTTHLAAMISEGQVKCESKATQQIFAIERNPKRSLTLAKMVKTAGADSLVGCHPGQDFLSLKPSDKVWANVGCLLLDPSCSGSGIVGRDEGDEDPIPYVHLPRTASQILSGGKDQALKGKKRKREKGSDKPASVSKKRPATTKALTNSDDHEEEVPEQKSLEERLTSLSNFQLAIVLHAFRFSGAHKVVYSTCSIYAEENEHVVVQALISSVALERGWRILRRDEQVDGMKAWHIRGDEEAFRTGSQQYSIASEQFDVNEAAQACLRCVKGTKDGTMGFFAVGFVRNRNKPDNKFTIPSTGQAPRLTSKELEEEDEWQGFSDSD